MDSKQMPDFNSSTENEDNEGEKIESKFTQAAKIAEEKFKKWEEEELNSPSFFTDQINKSIKVIFATALIIFLGATILDFIRDSFLFWPVILIWIAIPVMLFFAVPSIPVVLLVLPFHSAYFIIRKVLHRLMRKNKS